MSERNTRAEALLESLVADVRRAEAPELDWTAVEARLMLGLKRPASDLKKRPAPHRVREPRGRSFSGWLLAAAVAATAIFSVLSFRGTPTPGQSRHTPTSLPELAALPRVGGLSVGQRVVAGEAPVVVEHAGLATWELLPGGSAEMRALEPSLVIQLQSGRLQAKVVPSARPESFVVEVGGLRVAVRGTVFSVLREGQHALVEVSEGVVAVGPVGKPAETLLVGPAAGRFLATGERAGTLEHTQGKVNRRPVAARPAPVGSPPQALKPAAPLPDEPTFEEVERGLLEVEAALGHCLGRHTAGTGKVLLSLKTRATLKVETDGSVSRYRFVPPLSPEVAGCARGPLERLRFAPSGVGTHIIRDLEIAR